MRKRNIILAGAVVAVIVGAGITFYALRHEQTPNQASTAGQSKPISLTITLKNGKPVATPSIYLVRPHTRVEFRIISDVYGKVGVPVSPAKTVTFTQSPLVFSLTADKAGTYPITYQANGSDTVIEIGSMQVRNQ